jgi:hypothetical protein
MASVHSGKRAGEASNQAIKPRKKVKAENREDDKENTRPNTTTQSANKAQLSSKNTKVPSSNKASEVKAEEVERPKTPPPAKPARNEKTPGRVGPIKSTLFPKYDIAPFKGPKGKKVRKTHQEKEEEYAERVLNDPDHCFHELHVCFKKGPNGSPTYDKAGFELDYDKVAHWMKPQAYNKSKIMNSMNRAVNRAEDEKKRMAVMFFEPGAAPEGHGLDCNYWKDRVSKDLGIPFHKIGVEEFEKWEKMGFPKAKKGDYQNPSGAERERMLKLIEGASLRK